MSNKWDWVQVWYDNLEELKVVDKPFIVPMDYYDSNEIRALGIKCGERSMLHRTTLVINPKQLTLEDNVMIDGFCTISCGDGPGINIGSNVHIAGYVSLFGGAGITVGNYASIASGAKVYSISDDVMGRGEVGPCVPLDKRYLHKGHIVLG